MNSKIPEEKRKRSKKFATARLVSALFSASATAGEMKNLRDAAFDEKARGRPPD